MWEPELNFLFHCSETLFKLKIISSCIFKQNMELLSTTWRWNQRGQFTLRNINLRDNFSSIIINYININHLKLSVKGLPRRSTNSKNEMVVNLNKYTFKILSFISKNLLQWNKHYFAKTIFLPFKIMCAYVCACVCVCVCILMCMYTHLCRGMYMNTWNVWHYRQEGFATTPSSFLLKCGCSTASFVRGLVSTF